MEPIGSGRGVAALMNGRAKKVTPRIIRLMRHALPEALILVSEDLPQASRHVARICEQRPFLLLSGGGDGTATHLLNLLRERWKGVFPTLGLLRLGTGNGWSNSIGAGPAAGTVRALPQLPRELPTLDFDLLEVESRLCTFAGLGWDARVLNDYLRNLDRRSSQLFGRKLATQIHKGIAGYLYSMLRLTVPEELVRTLRMGPVRITLENLGPEAFAIDATGTPVLWAGLDGHDPRVLFDGSANVAIAGTSEEFGFRFRAFPHARAKPGYLNLRVYDRTAIEALQAAMPLWRGRTPIPGMHDYLVTRARLTFSRPLPLQVGGESEGERERIELNVAAQSARVVDWRAALGARAPSAPGGLRPLLPARPLRLLTAGRGARPRSARPPGA